MRVQRLLPFVMGTALAVTLAAQAAATSAVAVTGPAAPAAGDTVTLLTGDRVHVGGAGSRSVRVEPAPGRERLRFAIENTGGHLYVLPADAFRFVGAGRVDRRLFDVTGLAAQGFDDADRDHLTLAVRNPTPGRAGAETKLRLPKRDANRYWAEIVRGGTSVRLDTPTAPVATPPAAADSVTVTLRVIRATDGVEPTSVAVLADLHAALTRLPEIDREIVRLIGWEQLTIAEAAHVLACTRTAAKVRLHRARRRLAALLTAPVPTTSPPCGRGTQVKATAS